eukprot:6085946-Pyramimonas_sp.AAC.1
MVIKENAFVASDYPVIVTLENHCKMERQEEMAKHLSAILGPLLASPADYDLATASPEALRGKVLVINEPKFRRKADVDDRKFTGEVNKPGTLNV